MFRDFPWILLRGVVLALTVSLLISPNPSTAQKAVQDCKKAVKLYNQGTESKDHIQKVKLFEEASRLCEDPEVLARVYNNLADVYEQKGELSQALVQYRQAIKIKKDLVSPYSSVGDIFFKLGDYYSAFVMYGKALKIKPDDEDSIKGRDKAEAAYKKKMIIYFERGSSKVGEEYAYRLQLVGEIIKNNPKGKIQVVGHTCDLGSKEFNKRLGSKRAEAVAQYLKDKFFLSENIISLKAQGKEYPVLLNKDEEARILNRRVKVQIK